MTLREKEKKLTDIISSYRSALVAYSGGVDSSLLLYVTINCLGKDKVLAVIADSETYPEREKKSAISFCEREGIKYQVIHTAELSDERFERNDKNRCYYCKSHLFEEMVAIKDKLDYEVIFEGSNADDLSDYRPGRRAVSEYGVVSPLLLAGLSKNEVRELSRFYNLPTHNKPSKACLASRIPYGNKIEISLLSKIDRAENFLEKLGFDIVRVRAHGEVARLEVKPDDFNKIIERKEEIVSFLTALGFKFVCLDLEGYRTGSMNKLLKDSI